MNMCKPEKPVGRNAKQTVVEDEQYVVGLLQHILLDGVNLCSSYVLADYTRDCNTIEHRIRHEGVSFATHVLPAFFSAVVSELEGGKSDYAWFRKSHIDNRPVFLHGLLVQIMEHGDDDKEALHILYMVCHAFKKLKGPYPNAVLRKEIRKFISTDDSLGRLSFNAPELRSITSKARSLITVLLKDSNVDDGFKPRPGPGATNTPREQYMRYEPHTLYSQLEDYFPADDYFYSSLWDVNERAREYFSLAKADYPTSRFKFIHKYRGKPRGICIEENETQYFQQAVKRLLYQLVESHPMTQGRVCFTDQSVNSTLALRSSSDRQYATIDMSEASDRIARDLVFSLFRDTPILQALDAVSTRFISLPDGLGVPQELLVHKFAPMGSGVCFPVMALVHWALIRSMIQVSGREGAQEAAKQVYVYGDDIIVPNAFVDIVFDILPMYGMKLNKEKSFTASSFRESCGVHAYKGKDITPVYNNYTITSALKPHDSNVLLSSVAKECAYFKNGFTHTAQYIRRHISLIYGQLPYGSLSSGLLCWKREKPPTHSLQQKAVATRVRYVQDLQRYEYLTRCVVRRNAQPTTIEDSRAYLRWMLTGHSDDTTITDAGVSTGVGSASFKGSVIEHCVRKRWVPESAFD